MYYRRSNIFEQITQNMRIKVKVSEAHLQASKWVKLNQFKLKYRELHDLARPIGEFMKQVSI